MAAVIGLVSYASCVHFKASLHPNGWLYCALCHLQFPDCADEHGVSVSCLDLHYSVTVRTTKVKDEKKDDTAPVVLRRLHSEPQGHTDDATKIYGKLW